VIVQNLVSLEVFFLKFIA